MAAVLAIHPPSPPRRHPSEKHHLQSLPSGSAAGAIRSRRDRPCDACRRRKSRCQVKEGSSLCVLCEFHRQDCTFLQDPQPRKRKATLPGDGGELNAKKR
jgi:hypothetical protein